MRQPIAKAASAESLVSHSMIVGVFMSHFSFVTRVGNQCLRRPLAVAKRGFLKFVSETNNRQEVSDLRDAFAGAP